jgi:hypothetical protein
MDEIDQLIEKLKSEDWDIWQERVTAAKALGKINDQRAVLALIKALKDENRYVQKTAAKSLEAMDLNICLEYKIWYLLVLGYPEVILKIGTNAIPFLLESLENNNVKGSTFDVLETMIFRCKNSEEINRITKQLDEAYSRLKGKDKNTEKKVSLQIAKLRIDLAKKRNRLAENKGILLDDKPKLPKRGTMYQQARRVTNG